MPHELIASLFGFAMGFLGSVPLTGPIALLVFHRALQGRYFQGVAVGVGGTAGELIYCAMAVAGVGALVKTYPLASAGLKSVSALVMVGFGLYFLLNPPEGSLEEAQNIDRSPANLARNFAEGFAISAFNPILLLNWTAAVWIVYSNFAVPLHGMAKPAFVAGAGLGVASWFTLLVLLLRAFKRHIPDHLVAWIQRAMGAVVLAAAAFPIHDILVGLS
ncbi:MAG: LysE family translocator [Bradymonadaceae bacterium]